MHTHIDVYMISTSKQTHLLDSPWHMHSLNKYAGHFHVPGVILNSWGCSWRQSRHPVTALSFQKKAADNNALHQSLIPSSPQSPSLPITLHLPPVPTFLGSHASPVGNWAWSFIHYLDLKYESLCALFVNKFLWWRGRGEYDYFFQTGNGNKKRSYWIHNSIILTDKEIGKIK